MAVAAAWVRIVGRFAPLAAGMLAACGGGSAGGPAPIATATPAPPVASPTTSPAAAYPAGLSSATVTSGGSERRFAIHVPSGIGTPRGIVVVLHGSGGSGDTVASGTALAAFRTVADRERLIVVYPSGIDGNWNDCRPAGAADSSTADDTGLIDVLIARLEREFAMGTARVLVAGHSNGGMMAMRYAFERPTRATAVAITAANLPATPESGSCSAGPGRPVPVLLAHGDRDALAVYGGGCPSRGTGGECPSGGVIGAEATRDRWLAINGLAGVAATITRIDTDATDGGAALRHRYDGAAPVEWWRLEGAGHPPPSIAFASATPAAGPQNRDVEFAEIAWAFAARFIP